MMSSARASTPRVAFARRPTRQASCTCTVVEGAAAHTRRLDRSRRSRKRNAGTRAQASLPWALRASSSCRSSSPSASSSIVRRAAAPSKWRDQVPRAALGVSGRTRMASRPRRTGHRHRSAEQDVGPAQGHARHSSRVVRREGRPGAARKAEGAAQAGTAGGDGYRARAGAPVAVRHRCRARDFCIRF